MHAPFPIPRRAIRRQHRCRRWTKSLAPQGHTYAVGRNPSAALSTSWPESLKPLTRAPVQPRRAPQPSLQPFLVSQPFDLTTAPPGSSHTRRHAPPIAPRVYLLLQDQQLTYPLRLYSTPAACLLRACPSSRERSLGSLWSAACLIRPCCWHSPVLGAGGRKQVPRMRQSSHVEHDAWNYRLNRHDDHSTRGEVQTKSSLTAATRTRAPFTLHKGPQPRQ